MSKCFIILGMHRSATSLIAKGLMASGIHMGNRLLGASPCQPDGHFEDTDFISVNDQILKHAGGSWDNPPDEEAIVEVARQSKDFLQEFIESKSQHRLWGWKDPRTVLTIRCFMPFIKKPHIIPCFRETRDVARSLNRRDGMPIAQGQQLAMEYNRRLLLFLGDWYAKEQGEL